MSVLQDIAENLMKGKANDVKALVEQALGELAGRLAKLDVAGEKPGAKLNRAREQGVEVWDEAALMEVLGQQ